MSTLQRWLIFAAVIVVGMMSIITWRFLAAAGYFTAIKLEVTAQCSPIAAPPGAEDIEIDRARGLAFVAASDRRALMAGSKSAVSPIRCSSRPMMWSLSGLTVSTPPTITARAIKFDP